MQPAIFLDRDGVIIENRPTYVRSWEDVEFLPGSLEALARLAQSQYRVVIITNQAGIGRGLIARQVVDAINQDIHLEIKRTGGRIDAIYLCPHTPEDNCACRKPRPGMILQAADDLKLDLGRSILIGDNISDIQAGRSAGVDRMVLVRTGLGGEFADRLEAADLAATIIYDNLAQALGALLKTR